MQRSRSNSSSNDSSTIPPRDSNGELVWPNELANGVDILERAAIVEAARYFEAQRRQGGEHFILPQGVHEETRRLNSNFNARHPDAAYDEKLYDLIMLGHTGQAMQNVAHRTQQSSSSRAAATAQPSEKMLKQLTESAKIARNIAAQEATLRKSFQKKYPGALESDTSGLMGDGIRGLAAINILKTDRRPSTEGAYQAPANQPSLYYPHNNFFARYQHSSSAQAGPSNAPALTMQSFHIHTSNPDNRPTPRTHHMEAQLAPHEDGFAGVSPTTRRAYENLMRKYGPSSSARHEADDISAITDRNEYVPNTASEPSHRQQVQAHIGEKRNALAAGMASDKATAVRAIIRGKKIAISATNENASAPSVAPEASALPAHRYSTRLQGPAPEQPWVEQPRPSKRQRTCPSTSINGNGTIEHQAPEEQSRRK